MNPVLAKVLKKTLTTSATVVGALGDLLSTGRPGVAVEVEGHAVAQLHALPGTHRPVPLAAVTR